MKKKINLQWHENYIERKNSPTLTIYTDTDLNCIRFWAAAHTPIYTFSWVIWCGIYSWQWNHSCVVCLLPAIGFLLGGITPPPLPSLPLQSSNIVTTDKLCSNWSKYTNIDRPTSFMAEHWMLVGDLSYMYLFIEKKKLPVPSKPTLNINTIRAA